MEWISNEIYSPGVRVEAIQLIGAEASGATATGGGGKRRKIKQASCDDRSGKRPRTFFSAKMSLPKACAAMCWNNSGKRLESLAKDIGPRTDRHRRSSSDSRSQSGRRCPRAQPHSLRAGRCTSHLATRHGSRIPVRRACDACRAGRRCVPYPCGMDRSSSRGRTIHLPQVVGNRRRGRSRQANKKQLTLAVACIICDFLKRSLSVQIGTHTTGIGISRKTFTRKRQGSDWRTAAK